MKHYYYFLKSIAVVILLIGNSMLSFGQNFTYGSDVASNTAYNSPNDTNWNGQNGGTGFGSWSLTDGGTDAGVFIGTTSSGGFGNIDTSGESFGIYGHTGVSLTADRLLSSPLSIGQTFSIKLAIQFRNGNKGINLQTAGGTHILNFKADSDVYYFNGNNENGTFSYDGASIFTLTAKQISATQLYVTLTRGSTSVNATVTGVLGKIQLYCSNASNNENGNNLYFNSLSITSDCSVSTTWGGSSWSNGTPSNATEAIFTNSYDFSSSVTACKCTINGASITIPSGKYLQTEGDITTTNGGTLTVTNGANLVQVSSSAQAPTATVQTTSREVYNFSWIHRSSPINNGSSNVLANIPFFDYASTPDLVSQDTQGYVSGRVRMLNQSGWTNADNASLVPGKGFIIHTAGQRYTNSPFVACNNTNNTTKSTRPITFIGTVNNGTHTVNLHSDGAASGTVDYTIAGGDQNLVGNPYPSVIDADAFLAANPDIVQTIYLWTTPLIGLCGYYPHTQGFAYYNGTMGVASGTDPSFTPDQYIAPTQGFSVYATCANCSGKVVTFTNDMRVANQTGSFARTGSSFEKIQLSFTDVAANLTNRIGIGYKPEATKDVENKYDTPIIPSQYNFYSLVNTTKLVINGRGNFDEKDVIPLGFEVPTDVEKNYEIELDKADGNAFENGKEIILKDKLLNTEHNLTTQGKYSFTSATTSSTDRFELIYSPIESLKVEEGSLNTKEELSVAITPSTLKVQSNKTIESVQVYTLTGNLVATFTGNATTSLEKNFAGGKKNIYIIKITHSDKSEATKKVSSN